MGSIFGCPCSTVPTTVDLSAKLPALDGDGSGLALAAIRFRSLVITKNHKFSTIQDNEQLRFRWYLPGARRHEDSPVEEEDDDERHVERGHGGEQLVAQVLARLQQQCADFSFCVRASHSAEMTSAVANAHIFPFSVSLRGIAPSLFLFSFGGSGKGKAVRDHS